jgi:hypothetical protein
MNIIKKIIIDIYTWKQSIYRVKYDPLFQEFASKSLEHSTIDKKVL